MLEIEALSGVKKIMWSRLKPGMIFAGGVVINGSVPFELRDFPVLTSALLAELSQKFQFLKHRPVLVLLVDERKADPFEISERIRQNRRIMEQINSFRDSYKEKKAPFCDPAIPVYKTGLVEQDHLGPSIKPFRFKKLN